MSNILVSKKVEQVEEDTQSEASSVDSKLDEVKYWERIYKSTHKMSGHTFNTMILFLSNDDNMVTYILIHLLPHVCSHVFTLS